MKKLLFILLLIIPFLGFSQFEAGEYINADTSKIAGSAIIYPHADSVDQYYYSKMRDPSEPLDGVNLRTLFRRLADLDSLGLLVTDLVSGHQDINTGETQIFFPSAFDSNNVVVIPFVRRISDDAVIDYLINDVDSLGFDIVVWEDNVKLYYVASQNISHSSDIFGEPIYSADSSFIKQSLRNLIADTSNYLRTEIDPIFSNDSSYIKSNIRDWINSLAKKIDENDTTFWGRPETDPFYSDDSLFLNRTAMAYVSDSSQILHWADSLPTSGAGIATKFEFSKTWLKGGQNIGAKKTLGSTDNYAIAFKTNDIERMSIGTDGLVNPLFNVRLENTTHAAEIGIIYKGEVPFIHNFNYGNNGVVTTSGGNVFLGGAGNLTMGATATQAYHSSFNTFSGLQAGYSNTTGYNNIFSGFRAGYSNTTGYANTFSGVQAGYSNTTGSFNTFSGFYAGNSNTTGNSNTFSGYMAGRYNTTGYSNTFSGVQAGRYIADGTTALTVVSQSIFIGANTKAKDDNSTNEIVIGYNVTGNGSNTVTIGNSSITGNYFNGNLISGKIKTTQITAALTDNTPTDAEIDAATSLTPSTAGAGWQCTIKDNDGSGLLYKVESDGTDWYYTALTKAL